MSYINRIGYLLQRWLISPAREQGNHDKCFVDNHGEMVEYEGSDSEARSHVRFPVQLAVRYGEDVPYVYQDFILNISKGGVFIMTGQPLQEGTIIIMHFFIPPHEKLLGEFNGEVVAVDQKGMHVEFFDVSDESMKRLEGYLEGNRSLLDITT